MSDNQQILPLSDAEKLSYAIQHFKSAKALMDSAQEDSKIFLENTLCTGTVVHLLQMGGEAAGDVSQKIKSKHPDVPWAEIREMRNGFAHTYMGQETGWAWNYRSVLAGWIESLSSLRKRLDSMEMLSENARYAVALNALCKRNGVMVSPDFLSCLVKSDSEIDDEVRLKFWSTPIPKLNIPFAAAAARQGLIDWGFPFLFDIYCLDEPLAFVLAKHKTIPDGFQYWDAISPVTGDSLAHSALKNGTIPKNFTHWDVRDANGISVAALAVQMGRALNKFPAWHVIDADGTTAAHYAAQLGKLPDDFKLWNLMDRDGEPVVLTSAIHDGPVPADFALWLLSNKNGWTTAHELASQGRLPHDFPETFLAIQDDSGMSIGELAGESVDEPDEQTEQFFDLGSDDILGG